MKSVCRVYRGCVLPDQHRGDCMIARRFAYSETRCSGCAMEGQSQCKTCEGLDRDRGTLPEGPRFVRVSKMEMVFS